MTVKFGGQPVLQELNWNLFENARLYTYDPGYWTSVGLLSQGIGSLASRTLANNASRDYMVVLDRNFGKKILPLGLLPNFEVSFTTETP
ncbi:hypothetical protein ACI3PL_21500, partial [Lacticaseibacillus paracasei]